MVSSLARWSRNGALLGRRDVLGAVALTAVPSALLSGCCPCHQQSNRKWNNALNLSGVDPDQQAAPASLAELVALIRKAESEGAGVRMTGSGHSFSDVAFSEGYLFSPFKLNRELPLDRESLRPELKNDPHLVRVESGVRLRELNPRLFKNGLALVNMGGYDAQTIVGAAMTGTHGSGLAYGPIASQIESIELVTTGGAVLKVEPTRGITDPARFPKFLETPEGHVPAELIADDETFHALAVSLGCMGIVYAVVLRAGPRFWLRESRTRSTWGELRKPGGFLERLLRGQKLDAGTAADPDYYEIYVNPYPPRAGLSAATHRCVLTKRYKVFEEPPRLSQDDRRRGAYGSDALLAAAQITGYGARLVEYMNRYPKNVPMVIENSLRALEDASYVDISYNVFNLGPANLIRAYGIELAFDIQQTIEATERLFAIASELAKRNWMHSSPPSLRFVKRSPAHLAMMYGRDTMMLEMGMLTCAEGADDLLTTYEKRFMAELGARPHWGLDLNVLDDFSQVRALYPPSADRWLAVYRRFNSKGTFNAKFTDRLGISVDG
ncbi:MAG TPA: FAD-binding protein [Polyangiaceae bacterium]